MMPSSNGMPAALAIAQRRGHAGIGHRDHHVGVGGRFSRQLLADALARFIDIAAFDGGIGPGEIDIFEDAEAVRLRLEGEMAFDAVLGDHHHLARLDVAHEFRADDVQRAGFRGQDRRAVQHAQHQRAHAEGIAHADQLLGGQRHQRIGALRPGAARRSACRRCAT